MKVYTFWDSSDAAPLRQAELFRVWERSWSRHGWTPRLLTDWNIKDRAPLDYLWTAALAGVGGGFYSNIRVFNNGLKAPLKFPVKQANAGHKLVWMKDAKNWRKRPWVDIVGLCLPWQNGRGVRAPTIYFASVEELHQSGICL